MRELSVDIETFPIAGSFRIARSSVTHIDVVTVTISEAGHSGRGECRPYPRYNETPQSVYAQIETLRYNIESGLTLSNLQSALPAGAARNAVDCALWDLQSKLRGKMIEELLGVPAPKPLQTAYTLSIDTPDAMAQAAVKARNYGLLKMKIKDMSGLDAAKAVIKVRPDAKLIIDANEALKPEDVPTFQAALKASNTVMIEQPLPANLDEPGLLNPNHAPIFCADESFHTSDNLPQLWAAGYRAINIKLDKTGGLTEALTAIRAARAHGFQIMAGCMVGTSLAMAPMLYLAGLADVVDLDGPLLLAKDRQTALRYEKDIVFPPERNLWG